MCFVPLNCSSCSSGYLVVFRGQAVATSAGLWSGVCWVPTRLAKGRTGLGSECSALFLAPSLTPAPFSCPLIDPLHPRKAFWTGHRRNSQTGLLAGSIPSPSASFPVKLGLLLQGDALPFALKFSVAPDVLPAWHPGWTSTHTSILKAACLR